MRIYLSIYLSLYIVSYTEAHDSFCLLICGIMIFSFRLYYNELQKLYYKEIMSFFLLCTGIVESFDWFYRCCWAVFCFDPVDSQEHLTES